jgi:hypothetical protein
MFIISCSVCPWQVSLMLLGGGLGTYPRLDQLKDASLGLAPASLSTIILGWKDLPGANTLAYYNHS